MLVFYVVVNRASVRAGFVNGDNAFKPVAAVKILNHVFEIFQLLRSETDGFLIIEYGCIENLRLHKVLENMAAV